MCINSDNYYNRLLEKKLASQDLDGHEDEREADHEEHEWEEKEGR